MMRLIGYLMAFVVFVYYMTAFHYEIVFRSLPNAGVFYYSTEVSHLRASLYSNFPIWLFLIELFFGCALISGGKRISAGIAVKSFTRFFGLYSTAFFFLAVIGITLTINSPLSKMLSSDAFRGSRNPVIWLIQTSFSRTEYETGTGTIQPSDIHRFQYEIGHNVPFGGVNPQYPLWTPRYMATQTPASINNVIVLILESVGVEEMQMHKDGRPIMPNLLAIAAENIYFENFFAGSTKSNQVLPAIFAGIPPQTHRTFLWNIPVPNFQGLPDQLRQKGYQTAYFHGSDLSFEQQRIFLKMAGFDNIFDYEPSLEKSSRGWGYDDETMLNMLGEWIQAHGDQPYFTTLFTLSTHDPFLLPESYQPVFTEKRPPPNENGTWFSLVNKADQYAFYLESLHFLDSAIGKFYEWYRSASLPGKTLLIIVGDHVTSLHNESEEIENDYMRFSVPLIFAGIPNDLVATYRQYAHRLSTHFDIPATIAGLMGIDRLPGDQGINLFMSEDKWPQHRLIYAVGGHNNERVYVWTPECQVELDSYRKLRRVINREMPSPARHVTPAEAKKILEQRIVPFFQILFPLNQYLITNNAYYPPYAARVPEFHPIAQAPAPILVSHRGNTKGPESDVPENTPEAIEAAIKAGFEWVEIDIQLTWDAIPVLLHDPEIKDEDGNLIDVVKLKYEEIRSLKGYENTISLAAALERYLDQIGFLIEAKPQKKVDHNYLLNRKIIELIKDHPLKHKIIIDSFSKLSAMFIKNRCDCVVGFDAPYKQEVTVEHLKGFRMMDMDWVYIHHDFVTPDLIANAHKIGLRVMVYIVNDPAVLDQWNANFFPDGILTDYTEIKEYCLRKFQ